MIRARDIFENPTPGMQFAGYLATVVSLNDPDSRGRIQIRLLNFDGVDGHDGPVWARLSAPFAGNNRGAFWMPDLGDEVLVTFINGDSRVPVVLGGLWNGTSKAPTTLANGVNRLKVLRSKNGVQITMDDQTGQEQCIIETPGGQKVTLQDSPARIVVEDTTGNSITLESAGISITTSAKVSVNASTVSVSAGMVTVDTGTAKFSGVVKCDTLMANSVIGTVYSPGTGNVW